MKNSALQDHVAESRTLVRWRPVAAARPLMSPDWWRWVASTDSLTARLIAAGGSRRFSVRLLRQRVGYPFADEARALGISAQRYVWQREVALCLDGTPWVVARSVASLATLRGQRLHALGERSLGSWLFRQPGLARRPLEVSTNSPRFIATNSLWGRRSVFRHGRLALLVQEYFLPAMAEELGLPLR
ncbi:MAG: chorismate lyase [Halomonas sp.]|nr:chorismate lyase [Halomonas sp.]MDN6297095.1 chorismate lyase [Halomonas sp.]MDN6314806.1 chorismate lyase [Halomonas sp.]MDN6335986.1 chorismate lyase [Halomonas sp.]